MQTIHLPQRLDVLTTHDLHTLNQQLRRGEIRLDWSDVEPGIAPNVLHTLFTCLNALRDVEPTVSLILDTYPLGEPDDAPPEKGEGEGEHVHDLA